MILAPLQQLPNNVGNLGKIIVATSFEWLPKVQKMPNLVTLCASYTESEIKSVTPWQELFEIDEKRSNLSKPV